MPQQTLSPLSPPGQSGGAKLLNPTDRLVPARYGETARSLRTAALLRGTAPTYVASAASVAVSILPVTGAAAGGTAVTVTGTGFTAATAVTFGGVAATSFVVVSATSITAVTPAHAVGAVDVVVVDSVGNGTIAGGYTYA